MTLAMQRLADQANLAFPVTIYYAFKQSEGRGNGEMASTGWETFLDAVIRARLLESVAHGLCEQSWAIEWLEWAPTPLLPA